MKIYLSLCLSLGLCALAASGLRADDDDSPVIKPPYDPDINSPTYDGSTFDPAPAQKKNPAEIKAQQNEQEEEANWLVRSYDEIVQEKSDTNKQSDPLDPYERVESDKDLAKLAGLTPVTSPSPLETTSLHADTDPLKDGPTLRIDPSQISSRQKLPLLSGDGFKPLITPLSATEAAGLPNFYATLPAGAPPPTLANSSPPAPVPSATDEPPVTDMPGLTAAESHLKQGQLSYDLTFEPLPDDFHNPPADISLNKDDEVLPQAPSGDAAKQLHRVVLVTTTGKTTPPPTPEKVVIPPDPDLIPKPIPVPIIIAGRPQIPDPLDNFR